MRNLFEKYVFISVLSHVYRFKVWVFWTGFGSVTHENWTWKLGINRWLMYTVISLLGNLKMLRNNEDDFMRALRYVFSMLKVIFTACNLNVYLFLQINCIMVLKSRICKIVCFKCHHQFSLYHCIVILDFNSFSCFV